MSVSYPYRSCEELIRENENSLQCNLCKTWIHLKCNHLNFIGYKKLQNETEPWYCFVAVQYFPLAK